MYIVCLIFASLGICGSAFVSIMFVLNRRSIDEKAINDAKRLATIQIDKFESRDSPIAS